MNTSKRRIIGFGYQILETRRGRLSRFTPQRVLWMFGFALRWPLSDPVGTIELARVLIAGHAARRWPVEYHVHPYESEPKGDS